MNNPDVAYGQSILPPGIRSRFVDSGNGCTLHVLEAGFGSKGRPCVLLLHGFPEMAFSWRRQLLPLAQAGFHVLAPDLRGYGRSSGTEVGFDDDLLPFTFLNAVGDVLGMLHALGHREVAAVVGHDHGSPLASWCALSRPDVFRSLVMMSAPFGGPPPLPFDVANQPAPGHVASETAIYDDLAALPVPRKHYQRYYATREANEDMWRAPQGVHAFLRAYYHMKSADWKHNQPHPLQAKTAKEWARLPRYYVMDRDRNMAETVAAQMPSAAEIVACQWLPEEELAVYAQEYGRNGFQGGLQTYRVKWVPGYGTELRLFAGRSVEVPAMFIGGKSDWGTYQTPGAFEKMQKSGCSRFQAAHLLEGAGHWVQQEQSAEVNRLLLAFLERSRSA